MNSEITAVISSVTQNAFQTPFASNARLSRNAAGIITTMNLHSEIISDGTPLPSPSSEPEAVTDTDDTINPALIMRRAVSPAAMTSGLSVNIPIS